MGKEGHAASNVAHVGGPHDRCRRYACVCYDFRFELCLSLARPFGSAASEARAWRQLHRHGGRGEGDFDVGAQVRAC